MYAQTHIHVPRNKLIVARFCILMNLIFTYLISWNKPVHKIMVPIAHASSEGSDEPVHPRKIASALTAHIHNEGACRGCEFIISKALEMIGTSRNSLYLPHVCRLCYMRRSACAPHSLISTFVSRTKHETFCRASSGPKLSAKLVCHNLFVGGGGGAPRSHPGCGSANSISSRQRDGVMVHGHLWDQRSRLSDHVLLLF